MTQQRRYPIREGDLVTHMDGRIGTIVDLDWVSRDGLPAAEIEWLRGGRECVVLGYLSRAHVDADV